MTRTRYAPSPTGYMHVGNLRSALFAYLIAKHDNGDFILRIEDTDQSRYELGAEEFIYKVLDTFKLDYQEGPNKSGEYGPYIQSERLSIYKEYAEQLVREGHAYYCFCDEATLANERMKASEEKKTFLYPGTCRDISLEEATKRIANGEKYVIRQKMPKEGTTSYHDLVYGDITIENAVLEDQILIKSDGYPTYNFANVIDDGLMKITHVTRGNEYLSSTPKYLLLYDVLRFERPEFIHLPLVIKADGTKISKRNKDDNLNDLLDNGFLPEAIINYLALIGWAPKTEQEIFSLEELVREFDVNRINNSPGCYDVKKLEWFNHHYIMQMNDEDYLKFVRPYLEDAYNLSEKSEEWINKLLLIYKNHISFGREIAIVTHMFFESVLSLESDCLEFLKSDASIEQTLSTFKTEIEQIVEWNTENINNVINNVKNLTGAKGKMLYMPIRVAVSGMMHGPELDETIYLLGKEKILERLN